MAPASRNREKKAVDRSEAIYAALRHAIIEQALKPGARLPEDAIGEQFGVSRTIVRHALGRLATEGLAELTPNRGAAVAVPTLEEAQDVYEVRMAIERIVTGRLAGKLTAAQVKRLSAHVDEEEKARGGDETRSIRLATGFHLLLADMTGSAVLARLVAQIASRCALILAVYGRPHSSDCAVSEHRAIIDALATGDGASAVSIMHEHLRSVAERAMIVGGRSRERDIGEILRPYAELLEGRKTGFADGAAPGSPPAA